MIKDNSFAQNSFEWLLARCGIPTASEFDNLFTSEFKKRSGEMPRSYMAQKIAERWLGGPLPGYNVLDMELGKILEAEALPFFQLETGIEIERVGFCKTDDGRIGASPDALIGEDGGIECKCPMAKTHCSYLLAGVVPRDYLLQVHGSMLVTGRSWWMFMSYCRRFPALIIKVERNEEIISQIREGLDDFLVKYEFEWQRLCALNGGEPVRRKITRPPPPEHAPQPGEERDFTP